MNSLKDVQKAETELTNGKTKIQVYWKQIIAHNNLVLLGTVTCPFAVTTNFISFPCTTPTTQRSYKKHTFKVKYLTIIEMV